MTVDSFQCPVCGGSDPRLAFSALDFDTSSESFELQACRQCGLAQTKPFPSPDQLAHYYDRAYYGAGSRKFSFLIEYLTQLGNRFRASNILARRGRRRAVDQKPFRVLDIGCGRAGLLKSFKRLGCQCDGLERNEFPVEDDMAGINIHIGTLEDASFAKDSFDIIVLWHVLEHLDEPMASLDKAAGLLRPGGIIALAVPNFSSLQSRLFRSKWFHLDLPRHLYHFNRNNLGRALQDRGITVTAVSTFSPEQNLFGFVQSAMNVLPFLGKPNAFYELLKQRSGVMENAQLVVLCLVAMVLTPLALIELAWTALSGSGAALMMYGRNGSVAD